LRSIPVVSLFIILVHCDKIDNAQPRIAIEALVHDYN
jgi:hypothetical protein